MKTVRNLKLTEVVKAPSKVLFCYLYFLKKSINNKKSEKIKVNGCIILYILKVH